VSQFTFIAALHFTSLHFTSLIYVIYIITHCD
jgi:hypothetical protein